MLEFENISAHIQGAQILRDVTLSIPSSSTVSIIGRNGAGKTTLFRTLMGLLSPSSGTIHFDGHELTEVEAHLRPRFGIGYSPEDRRIFTSFTVEQNIELPAKAVGLSPQEVKRRLDHVYDILPELTDLRQRAGGSVSGGQGKIVALGRALMIGTKLVLLDEPFQGLAPVLAHRYADVLREVKDKNPETTLIITESSPELLRGFGDRTYQIERGEVSLVGKKNE
jgi:branched-chain amino acid transport system ATP-binding protein